MFLVNGRRDITISNKKKLKKWKKNFGYFWPPRGIPIVGLLGGLEIEFWKLPKTEQINTHEEHLSQIWKF